MNDTERDLDLLRLAGRIAGFGGWSVDLPSGEVYWSPELFRLFGYESAGGAPPVEVAIGLYPEEYRDLVQTSVERCIADGTPMNFEAAIVDGSGNDLRVRVVGEAVRDDAGDIIRIEGAFYDISEIVGVREERIAAQEKLARTLDIVPDMICFIDRDWRITFGNRATVTASRMSPDQLVSETIWTLFPELTGSAFRELYERAMNEGRSGTARDYIDQVDLWVEVTAHPTDDGIALFARDVTADERQRQQFAALALDAQQQAALLDASHEAMICEDLDNVVTYWNSGAEQLYGWTRDEVIGCNSREILYTDTREFEIAAAALLRDGQWSGELVQKTKSGHEVIVDCRWQGVFDESGTIVSLFAVNSDITQRRRAQVLEGRAQRMESLGTLAGGIAHDLNNVMTPLMMSVQLMKRDQLTEHQTELLQLMEVGLSRGADMIRQVLAFARGVEGERAHMQLSDILDELTSMALNTLPKSIDVVTEVPSLPPIVGDKTQVLQVFMNLVANARDAMPDGGVLRVTVREHVVQDASPEVSSLLPGHYALLSIEDTGTGMTREVLERIFEPFYTTKDVGQGTGLGLASSLAIVQSHGGRISAYSEPGVGSRFDVYLPLAADEATPIVRLAANEPPPAGSGELVLVVDDEASIRRIVSQALQAHGYRSVEASNGREAIEVFEQHADEVKVVLTDMMMPVMDGAATAAYFAAHHPHVALVAASGLHANGGVARASNAGVRHFVAKPFTTETLLRTLRLALAEL